MKRIETAGAPAAIGPYSQGIIAGGLLYTAGQIGIDPATAKLVEGGIAAETEQVLANLRAILVAAGVDFSAVVRSTIYLTDLAHFQKVNGIYERCLDGERPARSTVGAAALPLGAAILIDMTAAVEG